MADELESELKYSLGDPGAVRAWLDEHLPPRPDEQWIERHVRDRYVDTADGRLAAAGYGARLRSAGGRTMVTVKSDVDVDGALHNRREVEAVAGRSLNPSRWPPSTARDLIVASAGDAPLAERFLLRQRRLERPAAAGRADVLLSIDHVQVVHRGVVVGRVDGLEIELRRGGTAALEPLAHALAASGLVAPESRSKMRLAEEAIAGAAAGSRRHS